MTTQAATPARRASEVSRRWWLWMLLIWLAMAGGLIWWWWGRVVWFSLGDTDDNLRMMQVRALLDGQGWYDLRQYRLSPPEGLNIHWSRLVDLPLAAIVLATKPLAGTVAAEKAAIAIAPLLPLSVALLALGATARRLVADWAWLLVPVIVYAGGSAMGMFAPARIDHHGWQLAMLALLVAGLADGEQRRGGILCGVATAMSLTIGFEMMPYLVLAGAAITLRWIWDGTQSARLGGYGGALALGTALGFAAFTSIDNLAPRCDALTPPWLVAMVVGGGLLFALSRSRLESRLARLGAAAAAAGVLGAVFALNSPQCLGRPEGVSDELQANWLDNIREARPIQVQEWRLIVQLLALPVMGLLGGLLTLWVNRRDPARLAAWGSIILLATAAFALLFFQIRAGAASQLLAVPAVVSAIVIIATVLRRSTSVLVRVGGVALVVLLGSGLLVQTIVSAVPKPAEKPSSLAVRRAGASCPTIPAMRPLMNLTPATILTMVDLGPRLVTLTHHNAIAGPYHRNEAQILDVHRAFKGGEADARQVARKYGATLLMICPKFAETTVYRSKSPKGFYAQLEDGKRFGWLEPLPLPAESPLRVWRIRNSP